MIWADSTVAILRQGKISKIVEAKETSAIFCLTVHKFLENITNDLLAFFVADGEIYIT